ncbi:MULTISPECIES: peroxiredoxin [unclassified Paenibacillus]|uniref:peroxiredoxin n=1 Tax=unclassified Paenibacillus TaxID=185978 RepID=UPI000957253D|nr:MULTISPECIES: peroxiredoxin [unclassified Paenibacillus]ASS67037.1 peroxiredoxin [Paenibacillus sp. RUD330]SIR48477.1 peroxiredoxin Q/BCP [Paenibacillus sp. RU4X]SIR57837.1 peroxiredoxin Q/BCP [Paenibacillus sp. RU4T]
MSATPAPGQPAPDFTLPAAGAEREAVTLSQYRGRKVILYFYPKDLTSSCTQEACDFRDAWPDFDGQGAVVLGISPDPVKSHHRFRDKHGLPFPLLSDPEHAACEAYGVWQLKKLYGREYMGVVRSTFLIDEEGRLVKEWRGVKVKGHAADVLASLAPDPG